LKDSLNYVVAQLLKKNNILFDKQELSFQIQSHPSYPSLHAVTGVLDHFNIDNIAAEVPKNLETLLELPPCFLAQIETNEGKNLVIVKNDKLDYIVFDAKKKKKRYSEVEFLEIFTGIIVAVEKPSVEKRQASNLFNFIIIGLLLLVTAFLVITAKPTVFNSLFFITSILGVFISISIYKQELGMSSFIGNAFCSSTDEKKDCDAVLSSSGAKVFKEYKLSDFSLLYFFGLTLASFLTIIQNASINFLYIISILVIPVTIYSIYYQFKVVKKWCFLCLSIVGILWLQTTFAIFENGFHLIFSFEPILITVFSFLTIILIWNTLKPTIKEYQENKIAKIDYFKFKKNYTLFSSMLSSSSKIETKLEETPELIFGNTHSKLEIIIITNPFCGHCKPVHKMVEDILQKYTNKVKVIIRFNINTKDKESDAVKITRRLLEINQTKGASICLIAMGQIYEGESVKNWLKEWGECVKKEKYVNYLEKESVWCKDNAINFTPEILINGQSFPKEYEKTDLVYFIEDLHESCCFNTIENINNVFELTT
jgi:uncharacterized membrane protein/thiol-disulfide isomerase/thioredoxin